MSMMHAVGGYPSQGGSGTVEHREEYQDPFDYRIQLQGPMRERSVIAYRRADSADPGEGDGAKKNLPSGQGN
jgi:hypothetical protein